MADARLAQIYVLVVDNNETMRDMLVAVLKNLGFTHVAKASDGIEAIQWLRAHPVDLIITDWELRPNSPLAHPSIIDSQWGKFPPHNGASFVQCLRHSRHSPDPFVPVIMLTGSTKAEDILYARDAGVNEILVKPINAADLCKRMMDVVEKTHAFITSQHYKGPCRRHRTVLLTGIPERRKMEVRVISYEEQKRILAHD